MEKLKKELKKIANAEKAQNFQRFFKTEKGQYGEGDIFLGVTVPEIRNIVKKYDLELNAIEKLLKSKIHEHRLSGLLILVKKYEESSEKEKKNIFEFYIKNSERVNNWDLVDLTAPNIVGTFLMNNPKKVLYQLAKSDNLWKKRIAIISTYSFIKNNKFKDAFGISKILLNNKHDLIHKAVGWMLREIGKRDILILERFLKENYSRIPRTTLRYAIEKFPESKRKKYLKGKLK